jgi:chromosome segregation ATPase
MLRWLRKYLSDAEGVEQSLRAELQAIQGEQGRLSRRLYVIEQRLDTTDTAVREIGHRLARVDGRTSILRNRAADEEDAQPGDGSSASGN